MKQSSTILLVLCRLCLFGHQTCIWLEALKWELGVLCYIYRWSILVAVRSICCNSGHRFIGKEMVFLLQCMGFFATVDIGMHLLLLFSILYCGLLDIIIIGLFVNITRTQLVCLLWEIESISLRFVLMSVHPEEEGGFYISSAVFSLLLPITYPSMCNPLLA